MAVTHLLFSISLMGFVAPKEDGSKKYDGTLQSASQNQVVLMVGTELITFALTKDSSLTLNGKSVSAEDLKSGDTAEIRAIRAEDQSWQATSVKATRATGASSSNHFLLKN